MTHTLKCVASGCYGCPKVVKIVEDLEVQKISVKDSTNWLHKDSGTFLGERGLPPDIKANILKKLAKYPRLKLSALCIYLWEECGHAASWQSQVKTFLKNHRARCPVMALG